MKGAKENTKNDMPVPPISLSEHEKDKKELTRTDFIKQYSESSGLPKETAELAAEIYEQA